MEESSSSRSDAEWEDAALLDRLAGARHATCSDAANESGSP
jgi:hypothetical protein